MSVSEYVALSAAAYARGDKVEARKKIDEQSNGRYNGDDYDIVESDKDYTVFVRKRDHHITVACRGTSGTDDLIPDSFIAAGLLRLHPRARKILEVVQRYKVLDSGLVVTGHSLGGKLAALCGASEGVLAVTFNQGSSPMDSNPIVVDMQKGLGGYNYNNVIHFTTVYDGVSTTEAIARNNHTVVIAAPSRYNVLENHYLDAFNELDDAKYSDLIDTEALRVKKEAKPESYTGYAERQYYDARNANIAFNLHKSEIEKYLGKNETVHIEQDISRESQRDVARENWLAMENDMPDTLRVIYRNMSNGDVRRKERVNDEDQMSGVPLTHPDTTVDLFDGIRDGMTWEETLAQLDRNLLKIYGKYPGAINEEMAAVLRVKIQEFGKLKEMEGLLVKIGLGRVMNSMKGVYKAAINAWGVKMSAWALALPTTYRLATQAAKVLKGFSEVLVWCAQAYFLVMDAANIDNDANTIEKLKSMLRDPAMSRYTFWVGETLSVVEQKLANDATYYGIHALELIGGVFVTLFAPELALPYWGTVAAQNISEIPLDKYIKEEMGRRFNQKWYGGVGDVFKYIRGRDAFERGMDEKYGGVFTWVQWVMGQNIQDTEKWSRLMPPMLGGSVNSAAKKLLGDVRAILTDESVVGLGDTRYERLEMLKDTTSITSWNRAMQGVVNTGGGVFEDNPFLGGGVDMSDYETIGALGNREFKNPSMTIQEYADTAAYVRRGREVFQKFGADEKRYIASGGKTKGDKEDDETYRGRINDWSNDQALSNSWLAQSAGSEHYWENTTPQGQQQVPIGVVPTSGVFIGGDGMTMCQQLNPSKKRKVVRTGFDWRHTPHLSVGGGGPSSLAVSSVI